jgi:alanine racemase
MNDYKFSSIAEILGIVPLQAAGDPVVGSLLTDSRKLLIPAATLFFSLGTPQKSADQFIPVLYDEGVRCFVVDAGFIDAAKYPEGNFLQVENVLEALQKIVAYHRRRFDIPVIGITGSNGKTIVKEWLNQLLHTQYNIVRSPKSYNSQYGVPLSLWQMNEVHTLAIFEAGISLPGEMALLEQMIRPSIGIFTYAGDAHASGFENMEQKIAEKLKLFIQSKALVYCADDPSLQPAVSAFKENCNKDLELFAWSYRRDAALTVNSVSKNDTGSIIECSYNGEVFDFAIPFIDEASVHNAITCCCVLLQLGITIPVIKFRIRQLQPVEMRLELKQGINNCSIINDSYSSDLNSLSIALDFLQQQQQHRNKTLILSDMLQTGRSPAELYGTIAGILRQKKIMKFIGIGPEITAHAGLFGGMPETAFFDSTAAFIENIPSLKFFNETILLKGARMFEFEKITHAFEEKKHETVLEINLNALRHNLKFYRRQTAKQVKLMAMVKAFSYGSGSFEIANVMQHAGVDYLAVAYADEGVALRRAGIRLPIMVMNIEEAGFENLLKYELEPELYSFKVTHAFINFLEDRGTENYPVHIKLDTGMHRLGFEIAEMEKVCALLRDAKQLKIRSVFSHLAASGDQEHDAFTKQQAALFSVFSSAIEKAVGYPFLRHIANTSAIHRHPHLQMDMVRLGIGLYGVDSNAAVQRQLQNVTTLRTTISQVKKVSKGESIGYSRKAMVENDTRIATVRLGYADGYPRSMSNGTGKMLVNGKQAPVIGNVCMDMTMLDITGLDGKEGDEVIVFGEALPVAEIANWANTIAYEILTGISQRVKRVYFEE